ncbi:MAG: sugar translocase [Erysipelothrix sp.]|nr:sugar translocase [Erysipelothrix sp.]
MRTINSMKNAATGVGGQSLTIILQFISRTVFIYTLGKEYLGISSLFSSILQVLSITELGIGTAIVYSLYKPLAEKDEYSVSANMNFLRKAYFGVGSLVGVIGLILIPFLPSIMKETTDLVNINLVYILYLFQSVSSYWFFAYKSLLLKADQKSYIVNISKYLVLVFSVGLQIIILIVLKSFILYTIIGIAANIVSNLIVSHKVDKSYPYLKKYKNALLPKDEKKIVYKNLYGVSMYKINSTIVRSTDSIVISSFISTIAVGLYSNYHLIVSTLITMSKLFFSSFTASVGNLFVSEDKEKSEFIFRCLSFLSFWLYGFAAITLWILFNPFITLWVGEEYLFNNYIVLVIVIDFLLDGYQQVSISYKDACGLFWKGRYRPLATGVLNVVISVILAPRIGIAGVLLGTIISRLLTTWWFEPWMVHKYAFGIKVNNYFIRYFKFIGLVLIMGYFCNLIISPFSEVSWVNLFIKLAVCIIIPNSFFYVVFKNTEEFQYIKEALAKLFSKIKRR